MGARTYWVAPVPPLLYASGTPATNTTPAADFSPAPQITIYPGVLELGTTIHLYAQGELSTGTTADTLTIGFYYGGASSGVALAGASAVAVATGGSAETSVPWEMDYWGTVGALGSSGTIKGMGRFYGPNIATPLTGAYRSSPSRSLLPPVPSPSTPPPRTRSPRARSGQLPRAPRRSPAMRWKSS